MKRCTADLLKLLISSTLLAVTAWTQTESGWRIDTIAGTGEPGYGGDGGPAVEAQLASPFALTVDRSGKIYVADLGNCRIRVLIRSMDSGDGRAPLLESIGGLLPLRFSVWTRKAASPYPKTARNLLIAEPSASIR